MQSAPPTLRLRHSGSPAAAGELEPPLRVAVVAPPWIQGAPPGCGGIETVVDLLCESLVTRGHDVTLFAAPGSCSTACLRTPFDAADADQIGSSLHASDRIAWAWGEIDWAADRGRPFDVVHDHSGFTALAIADRVPASAEPGRRALSVKPTSSPARRPADRAARTPSRPMRCSGSPG